MSANVKWPDCKNSWKEKRNVYEYQTIFWPELFFEAFLHYIRGNNKSGLGAFWVGLWRVTLWKFGSCAFLKSSTEHFVVS